MAVTPQRLQYMFENKMFSMITICFCLLALFVFVIYRLSNRKFNYWKIKKVPFIKPLPIFGNYKEYILRKKYEGIVAQEICRTYPNEPYVGTFFGTEPMLLVQDPELIKLVLAKDFYYFHGRAVSDYTHKEAFTQNLFFSSGDQWKVARQNLTPLFSSAKMKNMFYIIENSTDQLSNLLDQEARTSSVIEVKTLMARYMMDCIGPCVFGVNTDTMSKNIKSNPFMACGDQIFEVSFNRDMKLIARAMWPSIFYGMRFRAFPLELNTFFLKLLTNVFETRQHTPSSKHDLVDLLLNLKNNKYICGDSIHNYKTREGKKIYLEAKDELLIGQCIGFFGAGFETSATTLSFTLYELAKNQEAQTKAIAEVDEYIMKNQGKVEYDCVTKLPYLDSCISEALRLYPVLGVITREVMEDYTFPDGLHLEKGLRVHIPVYHIHRVADHFLEPEKYRPERFLADEKDNIKPYTILSFGEGARICIGMRFAKMQMLPGLITVFRKYRVELAEGMPLSLELEPASIVTKPRNEIRLKFIPRANK